MKDILSYSSRLRTEIRRTINAERAKPSPSDSWRDDFSKRLLPYATAGKLMRGNLVCFSYEAFSGQRPGPEVVRTAIALELIHSALLIHDDVMDNDDYRRGKPSIHRQYETLGRHEKLTNPAGFGANVALCGGDMCLFMAFGLIGSVLGQSGTPPLVNELFADILVEVCDGQMQDIHSQARPDLPSKRAICNLMQAKTASYTLSLPLAVGAALAGQPAATIKKLRHVGNAAGIIFQIRDDELGAMGDTAKTGKPVGADIREGKKTLIYYYLMKTCTASERRQLKEIFGNPEITPSDIAAIQKLIRHRDIPSLLNSEINGLETKARQTLRTIDLPRRYQDELCSLIVFCARRQT